MLRYHKGSLYKGRTVIYNRRASSTPLRRQKIGLLLTLLFPLEVRGRGPVWIGLGDFHLVSLGVGDNLLHG